MTDSQSPFRPPLAVPSDCAASLVLDGCPHAGVCHRRKPVWPRARSTCTSAASRGSSPSSPKCSRLRAHPRRRSARTCPADERLARGGGDGGCGGPQPGLERVFRHAESASATLRVVRDGRSRLAQTVARFLEDGAASNLPMEDPRVSLASSSPCLITSSTKPGHEPESIDRVLAESLRFVLMGVVSAPTAWPRW